MVEKNPLVWILVLHWRGIEHTRNCLQSLSACHYGNFKVLLVDNGSDSGDGNTLSGEFPDIELLVLDSNRGFSGGCNAGIEHSISNGADFVWLLNNDATVEPDTLSHLVEAAVGDTRSGAICASVVERDEKGNVVRKLGKGEIDFLNAKAHLRSPDTNEVAVCDWISGSNMLLRSEALREVGLLNDDYFLYFEDVEICIRLRHKGWHCLLVPFATIYHVDGASTAGQFLNWRYYYHARNRLIFFSSYPNFFWRCFCTARIFLHLVRRLVFAPFRKGNSREKLSLELKATKDFVSGVRGKVDICP